MYLHFHYIFTFALHIQYQSHYSMIFVGFLQKDQQILLDLRPLPSLTQYLEHLNCLICHLTLWTCDIGFHQLQCIYNIQLNYACFKCIVQTRYKKYRKNHDNTKCFKKERTKRVYAHRGCRMMCSKQHGVTVCYAALHKCAFKSSRHKAKKCRAHKSQCSLYLSNSLLIIRFFTVLNSSYCALDADSSSVFVI